MMMTITMTARQKKRMTMTMTTTIQWPWRYESYDDDTMTMTTTMTMTMQTTMTMMIKNNNDDSVVSLTMIIKITVTIFLTKIYNSLFRYYISTQTMRTLFLDLFCFCLSSFETWFEADDDDDDTERDLLKPRRANNELVNDDSLDIFFAPDNFRLVLHAPPLMRNESSVSGPSISLPAVLLLHEDEPAVAFESPTSCRRPTDSTSCSLNVCVSASDASLFLASDDFSRHLGSSTLQSVRLQSISRKIFATLLSTSESSVLLRRSDERRLAVSALNFSAPPSTDIFLSPSRADSAAAPHPPLFSPPFETLNGVVSSSSSSSSSSWSSSSSSSSSPSFSSIAIDMSDWSPALLLRNDPTLRTVMFENVPSPLPFESLGFPPPAE